MPSATDKVKLSNSTTNYMKGNSWTVSCLSNYLLLGLEYILINVISTFLTIYMRVIYLN